MPLKDSGLLRVGLALEQAIQAGDWTLVNQLFADRDRCLSLIEGNKLAIEREELERAMESDRRIFSALAVQKGQILATIRRGNQSSRAHHAYAAVRTDTPTDLARSA